MNEEEFLKEHPSLKGKTIYAMIRDEYWWVSGIEDIHKTQLDKAKVREAIDKLINSLDLEGSRRIPEVYARQKLALDFATALKKGLELE